MMNDSKFEYLPRDLSIKSCKIGEAGISMGQVLTSWEDDDKIYGDLIIRQGYLFMHDMTLLLSELSLKLVYQIAATSMIFVLYCINVFKCVYFMWNIGSIWGKQFSLITCY